MKNVLTTSLILSVACFLTQGDQLVSAQSKSASAGASANASSDDAHAHEGVWKAIAAVFGGTRLPDADVQAITMTIKGENYEVTISGENRTDRGTCTFDTSTNPKRMTIKGIEGPNQGKTIYAIYEMKDARSLRVCYDLSGADFPQDFRAPKGTQLFAIGYRRQKE